MDITHALIHVSVYQIICCKELLCKSFGESTTHKGYYLHTGLYIRAHGCIVHIYKKGSLKIVYLNMI